MPSISDLYIDEARLFQYITDLHAKGMGYWFDGSDDYIKIDADSKIANIFDSGGSVVSCFRADGIGEGNFGRIWGKAAPELHLLSESGNSCMINLRVAFSGTVGVWATSNTDIIYGQDTVVAAIYDSDSVSNNPSIYINGDSKALTEISTPVGTRTSDSSSDLYLGNRAANDRTFDGEQLFHRFFNLELDNTDPIDKAIINGGDIPYKYIGASQTALTSGTLVVGKKYIIDTYVAGDDFTNVGAASNASGVSFVATGTTPTDWTNGSSLRQIGCVAQYEPNGVGHNQWIDNSGNELHGTVNGAELVNIPADHIEHYVDLTVTGNTSFTLPKGYKITSITAKETAGNALTGGLDCGLTTNGTEIVSGEAIAGSATVNCTLVNSGVIGGTHTTADDIIYFSDGDDDGNWNSASLEIRVAMQRVMIC